MNHIAFTRLQRNPICVNVSKIDLHNKRHDTRTKRLKDTGLLLYSLFMREFHILCDTGEFKSCFHSNWQHCLFNNMLAIAYGYNHHNDSYFFTGCQLSNTCTVVYCIRSQDFVCLVFNGTSPQDRSVCANCGRVKPTQLAKGGQRDTMHNIYVTQCNTVHNKNTSVTKMQQPAI